MDLLANYETLPTEVKDIINSFNDDFTYDNCERLLAELKPLGYTFDYGLDATPYDLRKIN